MTWRDLLRMLENMEKVGHSSLDHTAHFILGEDVIPVDIFESLSKGEVYLMTHITNEESDND
jgi:hypothetical protein